MRIASFGFDPIEKTKKAISEVLGRELVDTSTKPDDFDIEITLDEYIKLGRSGIGMVYSVLGIEDYFEDDEDFEF